MKNRGQGRILITGSIAGFMPGTYQAVYNATKAFLDSFSFALRAELKHTGVTVTCLMAGEGDVVSGWHNKLQSAIATIMPSGFVAEQHRKMAAPGTAEK